MSKTPFFSGLLLAAALTLIASCGGDDDDVGAICKKGCEAAASLKCSKAATCAADCEAEASAGLTLFPSCKSQIIAIGNCAAARPASEWECVDGTAEIKDGVCAAEIKAADACIDAIK